MTGTPAPNDRQVGGDHYKTGGEEHWDRVARLKLDYFQGQITKYVERWKRKNGLQDLEKAQHFLEKYMELVRIGAYQLEKKDDDNGVRREGAANGGKPGTHPGEARDLGAAGNASRQRGKRTRG